MDVSCFVRLWFFCGFYEVFDEGDFFVVYNDNEVVVGVSWVGMDNFGI